MTNGAPRTIHGYLVCHENGMPYLETLRATAKDATGSFCIYWAGLAKNDEPRRWRHFEGQGFKVVAVVASLMEGRL